MKSIYLYLLILLITIPGLAQDFHNFYDNSTLEYWKGRYGPNVKANYQEQMASFVPNSCRINLIVPKLPDSKVDAFNFYADGNDVVIPASAILFLDQIITSYVWLEQNGFSIETVNDYLGMLKHQSFSKYPLPWPTLGIPDNPYSNSRIDQLTQEYLKTSLLWIMAHEVGHVCLGHQRSNIKNEIEADSYATEMFRKMGYPPKGMIYYFLAMMNFLPHEGDFIDINSWNSFNSKHGTHPMSIDRLARLSQDLQRNPEDFVRNLIAPSSNEARKLIRATRMIDELVIELRDQATKDALTVRALAASPNNLTPRTKDEPNWTPKPKRITHAEFEGSYEGLFNHYLQNGRLEPLYMEMSLSRNGNKVEGNFNFGLSTGSVTGVVSPDNELLYEWRWGNANGNGQLRKSVSHKFDLEANWGYQTSNSNGGTWKLFKK